VVPAEIQPSELAGLVDFSERPRTHDWSLRSALVRYAQPEPQRVNDILELVRRTEWALGKQSKRIEREGPELWATLESGADGDELIGLLRAAAALDALGDVVAAWAVDRAGAAPNAAVDATVADVGERLDALGIPHEDRPGPRGRGV
jgi:hypothetical protein